MGGPFISASRHDRHPKGVPFKGAPLPFQMGGRVLTITKAEIITRICDKAHLSKDDAFEIVENTLDIIKASLERGVTVKISGFGRFAVRSKHQRKGRNPKTGAEIVIPEHNVLAFKASPIFKKTLAATPSD
jgi:integration host factor subunit alpha